MNTATTGMTKRHAVIIYTWLVLLTLIEVGVAWTGVSKTIGIILMAGTTLGKVLMISLYFMHLKEDRPVAWFLPMIPVVLALLFVLALFPDLVYHLPLRFQ